MISLCRDYEVTKNSELLKTEVQNGTEKNGRGRSGAWCLKVKHTKNVVIETLDIANASNLDAEQCYLAQTVAIFHDIGRFEQYIRYGTYSDQKSEDHATLYYPVNQ